ncbi:MAG: vitamin B12 dependent-methionine synthase activation domain-containing protein, partial [Acidobacteriota bacterium]
AVKIAPTYREPVVHVLDASRAVPVVSCLISADQKPGFARHIREEYDRLRSQHTARQVTLLSLEQARSRAPQLSYDDLPQPEFLGIRVLASDESPSKIQNSKFKIQNSKIPLSDLIPFIDWSPFFHTWELRGRYPAIFHHPKHGEAARKLFADAQKLLEKIVADELLVARAVYGFFPANRVGDDVDLYTDHSRSSVLAKFHFLRQQIEKTDGTPNWCLADFVAPKHPTSNIQHPTSNDYIGGFAVTSGIGLDELVKRYKADHDDYNAIKAEALADRLAEAFAEYLHQRARREWGYGRKEDLTNDDLIQEKYRGIRPAAGYPACPDHTEKWILWQLLDVEKNTGMRLTESCAMWPGSSVSGLYFAHPESKYFAVGKLGRDQVLDYHLRKGMTMQEVERWLGPYLNYDPTAQAGGNVAAGKCACGVSH